MKPKVTDDVRDTISVIGYNYIVKMIEMKIHLLSFLHVYNRLLGYRLSVWGGGGGKGVCV